MTLIAIAIIVLILLAFAIKLLIEKGADIHAQNERAFINSCMNGCVDIVESLIKQISILPNIQVKGLMTMAPYFDDPEKDRPYFKLTKG